MDQLEAHAEAVLRSASAGAIDTAAMGALIAGVLNAPAVKLAVSARGGGPHAVRRAIELAELVLSGRGGAAEREAG